MNATYWGQTNGQFAVQTHWFNYYNEDLMRILTLVMLVTIRKSKPLCKQKTTLRKLNVLIGLLLRVNVQIKRQLRCHNSIDLNRALTSPPLNPQNALGLETILGVGRRCLERGLEGVLVCAPVSERACVHRKSTYHENGLAMPKISLEVYVLVLYWRVSDCQLTGEKVTK